MQTPIVVLSPTVTVSTSQYTSGDALGGKLTLSDNVSADAPWGFIRGVTIISDTVATAPIDVIFYDADPSASTFTDNAAHQIASGDVAKIIGVAHCSDVTADGLCSIHQAQNLSIPFRGQPLYASMIVRGTPTLGNAADIVLRVFVQQDG